MTHYDKAEAAERRRVVYDHPTSRRGDEPKATDGPRAQMLCPHYEHRVEMGNRHRSEVLRLQARHDRDIADEAAGVG